MPQEPVSLQETREGIAHLLSWGFEDIIRHHRRYIAIIAVAVSIRLSVIAITFAAF